MFQTIAELLSAGLQLWASTEKTKYQDAYIRLMKEYRDEMAQPENYRSQLALYRIELELRDLARSFTFAVTGQNFNI
jgi:hypothetical protein